MAQTNYAANVAAKVNDLLTEQNLAAYIAADRAGIARTTMQRRLIDGEFAVTELRRLADVLGVDVLVLLDQAAA